MSSRGERNLVQFNSLRRQACELTTTVSPYRQSFKTAIAATFSHALCRVFRYHLECKAKLASKKLGIIRRQFLTPTTPIGSIQGLGAVSYKILISYIIVIAYNVEPFEALGTQWSVKGLTLWLSVETSPRCAFSTAFIMGSVLKKCLTCYLPHNFLTAQ